MESKPPLSTLRGPRLLLHKGGTRAPGVPHSVSPHPRSSPIFTFPTTKNGVRMVICPFTQYNCRVAPQNLVKHMRKVHQFDPGHIQTRQRQCQGCKQAVSPGDLLAHIGCQKPTSPPSSLPSHIRPRLAQDPDWIKTAYSFYCAQVLQSWLI